MKRLSRWGKSNRWPARIIIIVSFALLTLLSITAGQSLQQGGIILPSGIILVFVTLYFTGLLAYPSKSLRRTKLSSGSFYVRQKSCDFLLAASTMGMIVCISNQPGHLINNFPTVLASVPLSSVPQADSSFKPYKPITAFAASLKDETGKKLKWKERKVLLKEQLRGIKKSADMSKGGKAALVVLSILAAIGLLALVTSLACNLSCNGAEGASTIVMLGGTAVVVFLTILAFRGIYGRKKKPKKKEEVANR
jgi:hypothetical protein